VSRRSKGSVRMRTAAAATAVVALALVAGAVLLVAGLRTSLGHGVDASARLQAQAVATLAEGGRLSATFPATGDDTAFVQVLDADGKVVAASDNVADEAALVRFRPPGTAVVVHAVHGLPIGQQGVFRVAARRVAGPTGPLVVYAGAALGPSQRSVRVVVAGLSIGLPIMVALVAFVAWWLAGRALRPVEAVRAEVADIAGHEDLGRRVPEPAGADELARLARTMNAMLDRLEAAAQRQRKFVADASHELRSPVTSARTQLEVDLAHPLGADWAGTASGVLADLGRVEHLIGDLLAVARSEVSALPASPEDVDLGALVREEVQRARLGSRVDIDTTGVSALTLQGDPAGLRRAVSNLLDNACRHARSQVTVSLRDDAGAVELAVADDGAGIAPDDRERVFERFTRLDAARNRDQGGTGLGLAIVRATVVAHGGTVRVQDAHPGALFVVRLPADAAPNASQAREDSSRALARRRTLGGRPTRGRDSTTSPRGRDAKASRSQ
jgi:signal transduction histidine kinase